ncbi:MAG: FtsX-like permease family protein [Bacteroidales bacterium]|nr:FtsX-like permease family protein [Bacteroidales bacterium]
MKSYLKFLSRNKLYTAIEAVGLAVSLAFVILIGSYVVQQYRMAHENPDWERIYAPGTDSYAGLSFWDKEEIEMAIPDVEKVTRMTLIQCSAVEYGGQLCAGVSTWGWEVDPEFFDIYSYLKWLEGSPAMFEVKDAVVLSEPMARQLARQSGADTPDRFGTLIGESLKVGDNTYQIAGVVDIPKNSILPQVDLMANIASNHQAGLGKSFNSIGSVTTLCRVREGTDRASFETKLHDLIVKNYSPVWGDQVQGWKIWRSDELFWTPGIAGNGTNKTGNRQMVRLLTVVVLLLLLSAIFNYINLSFALSGKRAKEMAMRRLLGSERSAILRKYIAESVAFTAVCFAVALVLARLLVPMMNQLLTTQDEWLTMETDMKLQFMMTPGYIAAYVAGILLLGALCGLLPALMAARHEPVDIIKGALRRKNKMVFSKVFIIAQNVLAVFLIAVALVMELQMKHMMDRPTHSQVANRYYIDYYATSYDQMKLFKDKVEQLPFVTGVGVGRNLPGFINMSVGIKQEDGTSLNLPVILCDTAYFRLMGMEVLEDFHHPQLNSIWLDETAYNATGVSDTSSYFKNRVGINGARVDYIGGVVRDFPVESASSSEVKTLNAAVIVSPMEDIYFSHGLLIGTVGEDKDYDRQIMKAYEEYRMEQSGVYEAPWRHGFVRDIYRQQLDPARHTMRLLELFTLLAVLISLLGLLAMSTYFAGENTRQIAVRKVFGADVTSETWRSVRSYMLLVGIACAIGIPLSVWAVRLYLQRFAYRTENYWWVFVAAAVITIAIAFVTVLWQTLKAARTNPAEELKKE